jgi:hypothetical protein
MLMTDIGLDASLKRVARVSKGKNEYDAASLKQLMNHLFNFKNPHNITADQIQALSLAHNAHLKSALEGEQLVVYTEIELEVEIEGTSQTVIEEKIVLELGKLVVTEVTPITYTYGIRGWDPYTAAYGDLYGDLLFEISSESSPYIANYLDLSQIEFELMRTNFMNLDWAQFAIFDSFNDSSRRLSPDTSTYLCILEKGKLTTGDFTINKSFGFLSKIYSNVTTLYTGTSTAVGSGYLRDANSFFSDNKFKERFLIDSSATSFLIESCLDTYLYVTGTPVAGAYIIKDSNPTKTFAMASYSDSTNGGYGFVKLEVTLDGTNWLNLLDTLNTINLLRTELDITNTGANFQVRITLKNDNEGRRPEFFSFLVCTDPSLRRI